METPGDLTNMMVWIITIVIFLSVFLPQMFKIMRVYERGVVFRLGKFQSTKGPGLIVLVPFIDKVERVDLRVLTINVDKQRSEEHTSELKSRGHFLCRFLREKKKRASQPIN